ncbi:MAG: rhodanese-like domain-containing protein [Desulfuromonas sp.]|nr:rhodanese-like domain-containing protein [Desulfuromonas sp.]
MDAMDAMDAMGQVLRQMDLDFVGRAQHKITAVDLLGNPDAVLLDVRTLPEVETLPLAFVHHLQTIHVPLHELPDLFQQIPRQCIVGIFCPHAVRAAVAYTFLRSNGYDQVRVLDGGYAALAEEARPGKVLAKMNQQGV